MGEKKSMMSWKLLEKNIWFQEGKSDQLYQILLISETIQKVRLNHER